MYTLMLLTSYSARWGFSFFTPTTHILLLPHPFSIVVPQLLVKSEILSSSYVWDKYTALSHSIHDYVSFLILLLSPSLWSHLSVSFPMDLITNSSSTSLTPLNISVNVARMHTLDSIFVWNLSWGPLASMVTSPSPLLSALDLLLPPFDVDA